MKNNNSLKSIKAYMRNHWLMLLIILQPLLDILAYWTKSESGTAAGVVRLIIMLVIPAYLLVTLKEKKKFILSMAVIGGICLAHILNCMRVGYVSAAFDIAYAAKTAQMPILAICFSYLIKNEQTRNQAYWGMFFAAAVSALALLASWITGTANVTYGSGLGISGWVIDDLRCANSIIVTVLAAFAVFCSIKSEKKYINIAVPAIAALVLAVNGTKTCYYSIFLILLGFLAFVLLEKAINKKAVSKTVTVTLLVVSILAGIAYPLTPVYKVKEAQTDGRTDKQNIFDEKLAELGVELDEMTNEEKLADPEIYAFFKEYYYTMLWYRAENMFDRFGLDKILLKYDMTTDAETLDDVRKIKTTYAALMWDESDLGTKLFGIDVSDIWYVGKVGMENDYPAIFYYYGYVGIAAYVAFLLWYVYLIIKRLAADFRSAFTVDNFILLLTFVLMLLLAQFSGSVLRRPNVSIYLSVILGLIHYQTVVKPIHEENDLWGKHNEA